MDSLLRIGNGPEPESLDPQRMSSVSALNIARDLGEGLTRIAADGRVLPAAAQGWQIADGGRRYTFELRDHLHWSNGEALTASDFVDGLRRAVDPATGSPFAQLLSPIANADAITGGKAPVSMLAAWALSPTRLQILLKQPTPYFPSLLAHPVSFPVYGPALARYGRGFARPGRLVSNGAYQLVDWQVQAQVELRRNAHYWDDADTHIDRVQYLPTDDIASELQRYRANEIDVSSEIPLVQAPALRTQFGAQLHVAPYLGSYYYGFNVQQPPFAGRRDLRLALSLAIDRELIVDKVMNGLALPAYGWVPPGVADYRAQSPAWASWSRQKSVSEAKRLYAACGYSKDRPLRIELRYNTHDDHKRIATVIAAMWKQTLGVETSLINEENKVFLAQRRLRRITQVFRASWIGDYDDPSSFLDVLTARNGRNDMGWHDQTYDALIDSAAQQADPRRRAALLERAERRAVDDMPFIPIYWYVSKHLVKPRVRGWHDNLLDVHYSKDLRLDDPAD
ncbi:peptide ABC transporter substrate-binding protein [Solimonas terrae]|uniref:Peptide ABC transporter substrate-binding protein n=1 Tax=Solimonas terrae TaxID=1396819 RepID=A0A6M2BWG4_9GAMM|nr:peptide ABC transporter substrate-binding protein [Solimonas terrae]NGY06926.1 peptide ABC transporter substrate-binding protein [Solimonas terrae]